MTTEAETLNAIRQRIEDAPKDWCIEYNGETVELKATPPELFGSAVATREPLATMKAHDFEAVQLLGNAQTDMVFLLGLVDRAASKVRALTQALDEKDVRIPDTPGAMQPQTKPKDYAAECAMKCKEPAFKKFLKEEHGLDNATDTNTAAHVRAMLRVASRNQLNTDPAAAKLWRKLVKEFEGWQKHG